MSWSAPKVTSSELETTFRICERKEQERRQGWCLPPVNKNLLMAHHESFGTNGIIKGFHWLKDIEFDERGAEVIVRYYGGLDLELVRNFIHAFCRASFEKPYILVYAEEREVSRRKKTKQGVAWACKNYKEVCTEGLLKPLENHIHTVLEPKRAADYLKYLVNWCGFPKDWADHHRNNLRKM